MTRQLHHDLTSDNKDFFERVYDIARLIPPGRVTSYGAIAAAIGSPGAARMVGWAMNKSFTQSVFVPAHRVVNRNGILSGKHYFGGEHTMKELLQSEGVVIVDDKVVDFNKVFWNPLTEL